MSVRKTNIFKTYDYTWEFSASADSDKASSELRYKDNFDGWGTRCPIFGSEHPDLPGFLLVGITGSREEGGQISVKLKYETSSEEAEYPGKDPEAEPVARYSVRVSGREEHILTNKYAEPLEAAELKALLAISNGNEADENGKKYEDVIESELGLSLLGKIRKGNTAYKTGGIMYIERRVAASLSELRYSKLYKIDTPPGPAGGGANGWMYQGGSLEPSQDGLTWDAEFQWEYSPDGWDTDLYTAES